MHNVFKSQFVYVNNKFPFVPETRRKTELGNHLSIVDDAGENRVMLEEEINMMLESARLDARDIIAQANLNAHEILTQAKDQYDNIMEEAKHKGYEQGYNEGLRSAKEECVSLIDETLSVRAQIIDERSRLYSVFEQDLVKLSIEISKKVIYEQLSEDDEAFVKLVQSTVQKVRGANFAKIWVSPVDHGRLSDLREKLLSGLKSIKDVEILKGDSIRKWGCIIDAESGVLDGGVETRITQIRDVLCPADDGSPL